MRVEVQNFQSIARETVEINGFSVVVGRSNIGKSALVRAVKAALTGAPADNYVRHAADCQRVVKGAKTCKCFCSVRIVGADFDLLWEKGDAVNRYVFNGTEHTVVGKGTPEFLGAGFAPIYIGGDSTPTLLQVADQFRPLFILDRSGTAVADVLSDVAKLDQINQGARAADKDKRECAATRKVRHKDLKELDVLLTQYEGLDAVLDRVKEVEEMEAGISDLEARGETLDQYAASLEQLTALIRTLQPIANLEIPFVHSLVELAGKLSALFRWQDSLRAKREVSKRLEALAVVEVPEVEGARLLDGTRQKLIRWTGQLASMKAQFARFKAVEAAAVPPFTGLAQLHAKFRKIEGWADRCAVLEAAVAKQQREAAVAAADEALVLADFKALEICPTCRQPVAVSAYAKN